jgi:exopolysaccharide transport family protein
MDASVAMNYSGRLRVEAQERFERARPDSDPFGLIAFGRAVRRRLGLVSVLTIVVAVLFGANMMLQTPLYQAQALIMLDPRQNRVVDQQQEIVSDLPSTNMTVVDSEIEVLRSRRLAERIVADLNLVENPAFNPLLRPTVAEPAWLQSLKSALGQEARRPDALPENYRELLQESVTERVWRSLRARRRGMTYAIEVSAISPDREMAPALANAAVEAYLALQVEDRVEAAQRASIWLNERLDELRTDVEAKERAVEAYRAESGLLDAGGSSLSEAQISEVQTSVLAARADLAEKRARYRQVQELIRQGASPEATADVLNSGAIMELRARQGQIDRQIAELEQRYRPEHPDLQSARAAREDVERQVRVEVGRIATSLRNEVEVAQSRLGALEASMRGARGELVESNDALVRLRELEREAQASQEVYQNYLRRLEEVTAQDRLNATNARVVTDARAPRAPFSPNLRVALMLALALGLAAGIGAAILLELLDQTVSSADRVEEKLGVAVTATIPAVSRRYLKMLAPGEQNPAGYLVDKPMSAFAEAFRVLRTSIVYSDPDRRRRIVAVTSGLPDEGKTTTALCLARVAATAGERVLVVDCDLRRRSLNEALDIAPLFGLLQVLAGEKTLADAVMRDEHTSVEILPLADAAFTPRDVFGSDAMRELIEEMRATYDLVVFDCPPLLAVADARVITALSDTTLLVARWGKTQFPALRKALHQVLETGGDVIGVAINRVNPRAGATSYNDALYYYKGNKGYYTT